MYDKLVAKANAIDTSGFVLKQYEKSMTQMNQIYKRKYLILVDLLTKQIIMPNLVKKTDYDAKISDIESKYVTTAESHKFTKDVVTNTMKSEGLVNKSAIHR